MADTYLYGRDIHNLVPTLMSPNEVMDGAVVSGVFVYACYKNPTYLHQNNPIIWELQARHGKDLNFAGVIVNRGHNYTQDDKERSSRWAAKLAAFIDADAAILTAEGGGNSAIDMMLACQYMEQAGIKTTVVSSEAAGADGYDFPLFYTVPEADAIVSVGSEDEVVAMPEVEPGDRRRAAARQRNPGSGSLRSQDVLPLLRNQSARRPTCCRGGSSDANRPLPQSVLRRHRRRGQGRCPVRDAGRRRWSRPGSRDGPRRWRRDRCRPSCVATTASTPIPTPTSRPSSLRSPRRNPTSLVAGPAFNAGRYGLACGAVCAAVTEQLGIPAITGLYPEAPAVDVYRARTSWCLPVTRRPG